MLDDALALAAVKSGDAIIANATAIAANVKMDFVFIVMCVCTRANINVILTFIPNNIQYLILEYKI